MNNIEYSRLLELKELINSQRATSEEKREYMKLMFQHGHITKGQYDKYIKDDNSDNIIKGALTIGGAVLAGWLISKLLD
ncbi:hypothetical protein ACXR6G_05800 [Ancylomarina sp. YFZ004]